MPQIVKGQILGCQPVLVKMHYMTRKATENLSNAEYLAQCYRKKHEEWYGEDAQLAMLMMGMSDEDIQKMVASVTSPETFREMCKNAESSSSSEPKQVSRRTRPLRVQVSDTVVNSIQQMSSEDLDQISSSFEELANTERQRVDSIDLATDWCKSLISEIHREKERRGKRLAVAQSTHHRLGKNSGLHKLDDDLVRKIAELSTTTCVICGKHIISPAPCRA